MKLDSDDRLFLYGLGLFETILVLDNIPTFLYNHWDRMNDGAKLLSLNFISYDEWKAKICNFIAQLHYKDSFALRITLSSGNENNLSPMLFFHKRSIPYASPEYSKGLKLFILPSPRNEKSPLVKIKSVNYLENILAKEEALRNNADEGLWLNMNSYLAEGTMSNLFIVKDKLLYTPSLDSGCLPGTRRSLIFNIADKLNIQLQEGHYTLDFLMSADEIFMTNSLMGIMPVYKVGDYTFKVTSQYSSSSISRILQKEYSLLIDEYKNNFKFNSLI